MQLVSCYGKVGSVDDNGSGKGYAYRASKSALNIVNKSMSVDLADRGVLCTLLHPGKGCHSTPPGVSLDWLHGLYWVYL
jgi:NAD(P)-dependent dehydrogenase (short-subunit alcohol dehydrogenase family)